jgi:hypothetical protein
MTRTWGDHTWLDVGYDRNEDLFGDVHTTKVSNSRFAEAFRQRLMNVAGFKYVFEMLRIRPSIVDEYAKAARRDRAASVVDEAAYLQISANPEATYILPYHFPDPHDVLALTYWRSAFAEACLHGPRMVGALLLALDDNMFPAAVQSDRQQLLGTLATRK